MKQSVENEVRERIIATLNELITSEGKRAVNRQFMRGFYISLYCVYEHPLIWISSLRGYTAEEFIIELNKLDKSNL
ncbi:hypothetical protein CCP1ISM_250012 [Azospirillaceae bacterium]